MPSKLLAWNPSLQSASRFRQVSGAPTSALSGTEAAILLFCGLLSAVAVLLLEIKLKLPGHAILRAVFPMSLGLALVPRRGAGTLMGLGAVASAALMLSLGYGKDGLGSLTSLSLIGPCLDLAVRGSQSGRRVYFSLIIAGIATNLAAMGVQAAAKGFGWDASAKSLAVWLPLAVVTYPTTGAIAGLLGAAAWFKWSASKESNDLAN